MYVKEQLANNVSSNHEYNDLIDYLFTFRLRNGVSEQKNIYPDIIIHKRGTKNNYIIIETKKSSNKVKESRLFDIAKLLTLVSPSDLNYRQGVFIDIPIGNDFFKLKGFNIHSVLNTKVTKISPQI